jgi:uncharacterized heparinase superfamily protein
MPETSPASGADGVDTGASEAPVRAGARLTVPYPGLVSALASDAARRAWREAMDGVYSTSLYRLTLSGPLPDRLAVLPDALAPATLEGAQNILRGRIPVGKGIIEVRDRSPFDVEANEAARAGLHRFRWLAHLEKAGGKAAQAVGRALVEDWLDRFGRYHAFAWRADILGPRLVAWAAHFRFLIQDNDLLFRSRLLRAIAMQTRHLARSARGAAPGMERLEAAAALVVMTAILPEGNTRHRRSCETLRLALEGAVAADGFVLTRSVRDQAEAVAALARSARAIGDSKRGEPPFLATALGSMRAGLAMMCHGDLRLGCFHGSGEDDEGWIIELLDGRGLPEGPVFARTSGYARLAAGPSVVLFDCGGPPEQRLSTGAHAAPLAFELSRGENRIVVNGGVSLKRGGEWAEAARRTAVHATLQVNDADAGAILSGRTAARLGPRLYGGTVTGAMELGEGGLWADGSHDFYRRLFGLTHRRRLFLDPEGDDLRGEDHLTRGVSHGHLDIAIRWPLHPDCRATLSQSGDSVLIAPPRAEAWRLRVALGGPDQRLALEPSVYLGGETIRKSQSITLRAVMSGTSWTMRWAFRIEASTRRARRRLV